jgi:hypothetical protein
MNRPGAPLLSAEQHELAATARPWAENLLHTHADQRGRRDVVGLGTSLAGATLRFGDSEPVSAPPPRARSGRCSAPATAPSTWSAI